MRKIVSMVLIVVALTSVVYAAPADTPTVNGGKSQAAEVTTQPVNNDPQDKAPDKPMLKKPLRKPFTVVAIIVSEDKLKDGKVIWRFAVEPGHKGFIAKLEDKDVKVVPYKVLAPVLKERAPIEYFQVSNVLSLAKSLGADYAVVVYDRAAPFRQNDVTWTAECLIYDIAEATVILDNKEVKTFWKGNVKGHINEYVETLLNNWVQAVRPTLTTLATM